MARSKRESALKEALEVQRRASSCGFDWQDVEGVVRKLTEEADELRAALVAGDDAQVHAEVGDLLFTIVNIARFVRLDPEDALRKATERFRQRVRRVEEMLRAGGETPASVRPEELDRLWEQAKGKTHSPGDRAK